MELWPARTFLNYARIFPTGNASRLFHSRRTHRPSGVQSRLELHREIFSTRVHVGVNTTRLPSRVLYCCMCTKWCVCVLHETFIRNINGDSQETPVKLSFATNGSLKYHRCSLDFTKHSIQALIRYEESVDLPHRICSYRAFYSIYN